MSELAGKATLKFKAEELGLDLDGKALGDVVDTLKRLEHEGYHFEAADGSLELLMRRAAGWEQEYFEVESFRVTTDELPSGSFTTEATVKVHVAGERVIRTAEGNGPVNALDQALRLAIASCYPALDRVHLTDYKVRVLDTEKGTGAVTRVLIDSTNGDLSWSTIGVSENIIEASWLALFDSIVFGLLHTSDVRLTDGRARVRPRQGQPIGRAPTSHPTTCPTAGSPTVPATSMPSASPKVATTATSGPTRASRSCSRSASTIGSHLVEHEHAEDVIAGCVAVATRRASMFRRAPVIHDLDIAFTVWGYLDPSPPADLVELPPPALPVGVAADPLPRPARHRRRRCPRRRCG